MMDHPNIVHLKYYYLETGDDVLKLHLIMNYIQETLHRILVQFRKRAKLIPPVFIKVRRIDPIHRLQYYSVQLAKISTSCVHVFLACF